MFRNNLSHSAEDSFEILRRKNMCIFFFYRKKNKILKIRALAICFLKNFLCKLLEDFQTLIKGLAMITRFWNFEKNYCKDTRYRMEIPNILYILGSNRTISCRYYCNTYAFFAKFDVYLKSY